MCMGDDAHILPGLKNRKTAEIKKSRNHRRKVKIPSQIQIDISIKPLETKKSPSKILSKLLLFHAAHSSSLPPKIFPHKLQVQGQTRPSPAQPRRRPFSPSSIRFAQTQPLLLSHPLSSVPTCAITCRYSTQASNSHKTHFRRSLKHLLSSDASMTSPLIYPQPT